MSLEESMQAAPAYDGQPARVITLQNHNGMTVALMDIGATWISARVPLKSGGVREVLLGESTINAYHEQAAFFGASIGRYANRIAQGRFTLAGTDYQVDCNQAGNCLHGGRMGFDKRRWTIEEQQAQQVTFGLLSVDGDQGFPGNLNVTVTFELQENNTVAITYEAQTDKACPVNLTNHAYFNLMGADAGMTILEHQLSIDSDQYLPVDGNGIPLGGLAMVENTSFDFRRLKPVGLDLLADEQQQGVKGYDHSYFFTDTDMHQPKARLVAPDNQLTMTVYSNQPALQLYTGNWLAGTPARYDQEYVDYAGIALETQVLPDSPNHPEWPQQSAILQPDERYLARTCYQFE